jgi:hypothetical protein
MEHGMPASTFDARPSADERARLAALDTPRKIQDFLDGIVYEPEYFNRSPLRVLREGRGHCLDGALFAAYALSRLGHPPVVVDLIQEPGLDDDHVLALFRRNGRVGSLAKSNFTGLRYREPVYASVRELVMSYFEDFFNVNGVRTLRGYTASIDLRRFDRLNWPWDDAGCDAIERSFKTTRRYPLITPEMAAELTPLDPSALAAGTLGSHPEGLYKPPA